MTREQIAGIVCGCLAEISIAPPNWSSVCEQTRIGSFNLSDEDKTSWAICVKRKLGEHGCDAPIGTVTFTDEATVAQSIDAVVSLHACG